ncbi:hypothetical protein C0989_002478 [Termitomyces sp. Mn162]|nr:hypothetical protein C0989_002478 [Termitomyces sp. Mn162]
MAQQLQSSYHDRSVAVPPSPAVLEPQPRQADRRPAPARAHAQPHAQRGPRAPDRRIRLEKAQQLALLDPQGMGYYVALTIILVVTALVTIYHKQIVFWLNAHTQFLHHKLGWLIPIAVLFVISFPPLFGHEIVAILCGLVWGMWIGFAIVAAGTFIGEIGNF